MALSASSLPPHYSPEHAERVLSPFDGVPHHNLQRKAAIARAGAINHKRDVILLNNPDFDLSRTIFASVHGKLGLKRMILRARLGHEPCWKDDAKEEIEQEYQQFAEKGDNQALVQVAKGVGHSRDILNFMESDCDFRCEHADGTFMDHLHFCHDYGAVHYKQHSPRVLFLHSIMGVGTNVFPMTVDKTDKLRSMLTPEEFKHIEAFPSILRLVNHKKLTDELLSNAHRLDKLELIEFHRVIDNKPLSMTADDLWVAMNYQMVHQLDFLPCTNWSREMADPLFQVFVELYNLLTKTNKLVAEVNMDLSSPLEKDEFGAPLTVGTVISKIVPAGLKRKEMVDSIANYSKVIGHDIGYRLVWTA